VGSTSVSREFKHHQRARTFTLIDYYWLVPGMNLSMISKSVDTNVK